MTARVVPIGTADGSRAEMAATLRSIADDVEHGRTTNVAVACVLSDGAIGTYHGATSTQEAPFALLGAITHLESRVLREGSRVLREGA